MQSAEIMKPVPLFSIVTATYNAAETLERTLKSVDSQTFCDYEHLIVDGLSKDATLDILSSYENPRRRVISEKDSGIYDAMNKGIQATTGKYLIFLNAGDMFHQSDTLECIAKIIESDNALGVVYGQTDIVDDNGRRLGDRHLHAPENLVFADFAQGMVVCHQAFVAERSYVEPYDLKYRFSADYDWCVRILKKNPPTKSLGETVVIDYLAEGTTTKHHRQSLYERFRIMCHYYGFWRTSFRHIGFVWRYLRRRSQKPANCQ